MNPKPRRHKEREGAILPLNAAIKVLNLAEKISTIAPAKTVFGSVSALLTMIKDSLVNELDCVELGLFCADVCRALERGINEKKADELNRSVYDAINQLTSIVAGIQRKLAKWSARNVVSRRLHAKNDKETITTWRSDLNKILQVLNELATNADIADSATRRDVADTHTTASDVRNDVVNARIIVSDIHHNTSKSPKDIGGQEEMPHASAPGESPPPLPKSTHGTVSDIRHDIVKARAIISELEHDVTSTHTMVSDIYRTMVKGQEGKNLLTQASTLGESPPPAPRACVGRDGLIEEIIGRAENLMPTALIGPGGIGKTSIVLTVLHHDRIKRRFGANRRFIRCDQFPASSVHFLSRLSKVIGAGVENPEDLAVLRPFLSSKEVLIVLDNAESILDTQGTDTQEIYAMVEELSRLGNICLCITSRISTVPPDCETFDIPILSTDAARDAFHRIYKSGGQPNLVDDILSQLDFHPLSITLLATVAHHSKWDMVRLTREWEQRRMGVLQTQHSTGLAATIELSLASPMFQQLGPDARALLRVISFFPQGVNENNLDWLFPTISNRNDIFDKFCILSLTYRNDGFITILAPLRDHLSPKDPKSFPLLRTAKECYFTRMSVDLHPNKPNFGEAQWITSEDTNVEHLLDIFTTIDADSDSVWSACANFMRHLFWHKKRLVVLKPKIEGLPDDHRFKPDCLFELSQLFRSVGNQVERKRLLTHASKLHGERGNNRQVARILRHLSDANRQTGLHKEGIPLAEEALAISERLGDTAEQARCLIKLAFVLRGDNQLDAAEEAASRAIDLLPPKGDQFQACESHRLLGNIYRSKGETKNAVHHFEIALGIGSPFNWHGQLFWACYSLAALFLDEGRLDDAQAHIERAKSHAVNSTYNLGHAMKLQARVWRKHGRLEEAKSEALRAVDVFEKLGAAKKVGDCRKLLRHIQKELKSPVASGQSGSNSRGTKR